MAVELQVHDLARDLADAFSATVLKQRCTNPLFSAEGTCHWAIPQERISRREGHVPWRSHLLGELDLVCDNSLECNDAEFECADANS